MSSSPTARGVQRDFPLARLTTIRAGGAAQFFARPGTVAALERHLRWAADRDLPITVIGSGSNLLVADEGVAGLVLKLARELATIEADGRRIVCGGGARLPRVAARTASLGLSGLEFGVNIPGTVGGAVKMNANAYGGDLSKVLEWVDVVTAAGCDRRQPADLGLRYRQSDLRQNEVAARAGFLLEPADTTAIARTLRDMRSERRSAQPVGIKTFGSTFKNPSDPRAGGRSAGQLLEAAGCRGLAVGGARFSARHANFVENAGSATTADVLELMAEGKRRVRRDLGVELEPEVQVVGTVHWPEGL